MKLKFSLIWMLALGCLLYARSAQALTVSGVMLSDTNITYETGGIPNGTTVSFTIDSAGVLQVAINCGIVNTGDTGTNVANLSQTYLAPITSQIFWNGLWLIAGDTGRLYTSCQLTLTLTNGGNTSTPTVAPNLVNLRSVDIHNLAVASSIGSNGTSSDPYTITYALAKPAFVTMTVINSSQTIVRTLLSNALQAAEGLTISTHTVSWDGLSSGGDPVPLGVYTVAVNAVDQAIPTSSAIPRMATVAVQSLAGAAKDSQKLFETNAYIFPNPVRNGQGTFNIESIRDGANISLRIYTITGDLVWEKKYANLTGGTILQFAWNATNQAGNKVGRGLYYYVVREEDSIGVLQTVKKMAVLP